MRNAKKVAPEDRRRDRISEANFQTSSEDENDEAESIGTQTRSIDPRRKKKRTRARSSVEANG